MPENLNCRAVIIKFRNKTCRFYLMLYKKIKQFKITYLSQKIIIITIEKEFAKEMVLLYLPKFQQYIYIFHVHFYLFFKNLLFCTIVKQSHYQVFSYVCNFLL